MREALVLQIVALENVIKSKHNLDYNYICHNIIGSIITFCLPSIESIVPEGKILTSAG